MPDNEDRSFDPPAEEATRTRMQGGGMGARELDSQRDPERANASEVLADEASQALEAGEDDNVEGMQQGRSNTNREYPDPTEGLQGAKTRKANLERVRGNPDFNPR